MSSYVTMKLLESAPQRYDRGIRWLSGGTIGEVYAAVAAASGAAPGVRVLDLGCGTGAVSLACAALGADVVGIDRSGEMLAVARQRAPAARQRAPAAGQRAPAAGSVEWLEIGALELEDHFEPASVDAVVSCLMFSELEPDEQPYVLRTALTILRPGGVLAIADEVRPAGAGGRLGHRLARAPLELATYILTQTTTRPVDDLDTMVAAAGFADVTRREYPRASMALVTARRDVARRDAAVRGEGDPS